MIDTISGVAATATPQATAFKAGTTKTEPAKVATAVETQPISPRLRFDPTSGVVVTEFLNGNNVTSQTPSAAALAYLRVGLSADGLSKPDDGTAPPPHAEEPVEA